MRRSGTMLVTAAPIAYAILVDPVALIIWAWWSISPPDYRAQHPPRDPGD